MHGIQLQQQEEEEEEFCVVWWCPSRLVSSRRVVLSYGLCSSSSSCFSLLQRHVHLLLAVVPSPTVHCRNCCDCVPLSHTSSLVSELTTESTIATAPNIQAVVPLPRYTPHPTREPSVTAPAAATIPIRTRVFNATAR